jgi:hypothetical protein
MEKTTMRLALVVLVLLTFGCDRFKKKTDAGVVETPIAAEEDTGTTAAPEDSGVAAAAPAANEADIKHFPDEEKVTGDQYAVEWPTVLAHTEPGAGKEVATLAKGTKANLQARRGRTVLVTFADPKDAARTLIGWVAEDAFIPGTTPPPAIVRSTTGAPKAAATGVCGAGLTLLFDADAFCGKTCKVDKDCSGGLVCSGTAKPLTATGLGAPVTICGKAKKPVVAAVDAGVVAAKPDAATPAAAADAGAAPPAGDAGRAVLTPLRGIK